ncbi:hypothetical protein KHM83_16770 [Fusibacter paucivorans]|uniref:Permuted papain-like amidase enzyme, YaeF/YiiX, C92 family n=1 Tax=Fusibacter paucivorans TaxID=76009 RepID=A0ABS5PT50_9FIRM|nr:hypothetical protein [Fusibacter paucivorans]MBS7528345.1 hypothetical protein [Fusibacter paucivorans]
MHTSEKRVITVLLTRYYNVFSSFLYYLTGRGYTHASIALDEKNNYYYSFNFKGFRKEFPQKHRQRGGKSISFKLAVNASDFEKIQHKIEMMEMEQSKLHYSRIGVFLCLLHIPHKRKNHYFCSQFVAEILQLSDSIKMKKHASLYLPNQLPSELAKQACLKEITHNPLLPVNV